MYDVNQIKYKQYGRAIVSLLIELIRFKFYSIILIIGGGGRTDAFVGFAFVCSGLISRTLKSRFFVN